MNSGDLGVSDRLHLCLTKVMLSNKRVKMNQNRCPLGAEAVFWNDVRSIARRSSKPAPWWKREAGKPTPGRVTSTSTDDALPSCLLGELY